MDARQDKIFKILFYAMSQRHRNWVYTSTEHKEEIKPIETCLHVRAEVHQGTRKQVSLMITHTDAIHQFTRWLPIQVSVKELRCVLCFISTQWWYTISMVAGIYRTYHLSNKQAANWPVAISDAELTLLDFFCHSWWSLCQINWHGVMSCSVPSWTSRGATLRDHGLTTQFIREAGQKEDSPSSRKLFSHGTQVQIRAGARLSKNKRTSHKMFIDIHTQCCSVALFLSGNICGSSGISGYVCCCKFVLRMAPKKIQIPSDYFNLITFYKFHSLLSPISTWECALLMAFHVYERVCVCGSKWSLY